MNLKERWVFKNNWGTEEEKAKALEFLSDSRFRRLAPHKRDSLVRMLKTPGGQELDLLKRVWGKTPSQVVHIMAQEFADRFGYGHLPEYVQAVIKELSPSHTWPELDLKISLFSKVEHCSKDFSINFNDSLNFWDRMRFLIRPLPRGNRKKTATSSTSVKLQRPKDFWRYEVCELCWRTIPVNLETSRRGQLLCFVHDLNPNDSIYRKHKRLKDQVLELAWGLENQLRAEYPCSVSSASDRERHRHLNRIHMVTPQSPLQNLVEYILSHFKGCDRGMPSGDEDVLEIFHGPFPQRLDPIYREAMGEYIRDRAFFEPLVDIPQLALAEAWLTALKTDRRRKTEK